MGQIKHLPKLQTGIQKARMFLAQKYISGVECYASKRLYKFTITQEATELKDYS
jgi:hypothetical protein